MRANRVSGGGSGIRTHDTVSRIHAFQASAFSHSATPPVAGVGGNIARHLGVTSLAGQATTANDNRIQRASR
jgi:hypothetical protein